MEGWRLWRRGWGKKRNDSPKQRGILLTPTGLLMEGHYTQVPRASQMSVIYGDFSRVIQIVPIARMNR
jgi:hypothetical protein